MKCSTDCLLLSPKLKSLFQVLIFLFTGLTTLVASSWPCFILSFAIFSSFVGDIERLTAADTSSLDSAGLMVC